MFGHFKNRHGEGWGRRFAREEGCGPQGEGRGPLGRGHGRHGAFREGGFGEGRGRGRFFEQGQLRLVLLALINEAPRHGYELIKAIEDRLGGGYSPSPGVIYPTLTLLNELGYATVSDTEGARKLYTITPEGEAHLAENKAMVEAIFSRIARAFASAEGGRPPQVVRAIENLKTALRMKLSTAPLTAPQAEAIAEALDQAVRAIEKA